MLSVIVPTLNEATGIAASLAPLQPLRGQRLEIIVVDGGSDDSTREIAAELADRIMTAPRGRASQMNAGAKIANGETLLFLHADTRLSAAAVAQLDHICNGTGPAWGHFSVRPDTDRPLFRLITTLMNWRSCLTGIATGDQVIVVQRDLFRLVCGFPDIPLMEDIALSRQLKAIVRPACFSEPVTISMRYWERNGVVRSMLRMWWLRLAYFFGASPEKLYHHYYGQ